MQPSENYFLILHHDQNRYCWSLASSALNSNNVAISIQDWGTAFGVPGCFMNDESTHFGTSTLRLLAKNHLESQPFTTAYFQGSSGGLQRPDQELLQAL